jgi:hypothetical protein
MAISNDDSPLRSQEDAQAVASVAQGARANRCSLNSSMTMVSGRSEREGEQ